MSLTGHSDPGDGQAVVDRFFDTSARYWRDVYEREDLQGLIYRQRMAIALRWVREAGVAPGAPTLEVGSGAGFISAQLAQGGLKVTATDSSSEMVELTRSHARQVGVEGRVHALIADAHDLPFAASEFDLVVALGLLPWLHDPSTAVRQLARVLKPGGWLIVTADNRARLNFLLEPRENPLLIPLKLVTRTTRRALGRRASSAPSRLHLPAQIDRFLLAGGLVPVRRATVGYGPFTFLGRPLLAQDAGLRLHARLERLAEHRIRPLRRHGWHYIVAAQKSRG